VNVSERSTVQLGMRIVAITAVFAIVALASLPVTAAWDDTEHVSKTLPLEAGGTLRIKSFSGHVTVTASDRPEATIEAVRRGTRAQLDRVKLDIYAEGSNTVVINADRRESSWFFGRNTVVDTDLDVKVPRRTNVDVSVFSAPVTVTGIEGSHSVHSFSSRLDLTEITGSVDAHTFSGAVKIWEKAWQSDQRVDVQTFSGNVELHVPDSARGSVTFRTFSGHLDSQLPLTLRSSNRKNLEAQLGNGDGGRLSFKTFSGNVKIDH
jgi:DUF4097 and DUF4098 domain-containing protein YvlB